MFQFLDYKPIVTIFKTMNFTFVVHIGQKIKTVVEEKRFPINDFAIQINKSRTVVYNIFSRKTIDTGLLQKISIVLEHNFFSYYIEKDLLALEGGEVGYLKRNKANASLVEELAGYKKELGELKEKNAMLIKINHLLETKPNKYKK